MIALLGSIAVALIFAGGAVSVHDFLLGCGIMAIGVVALGTMFAALQTGGRVYGFNVEDGITIRQLKSAILPCADDMRVYIGDTGIHAAGSMFECRLDGTRAFVIERQVETAPQATNIYVKPNDSMF